MEQHDHGKHRAERLRRAREQSQQQPPTTEELAAAMAPHAEKMRGDFSQLGGVGVTHDVYEPGYMPLVYLHINGTDQMLVFTVAGALRLADDIARHARDAEHEAALGLVFEFHGGDAKSARAMMDALIVMRDQQREIEAKAGGSALDEHIAKLREQEQQADEGGITDARTGITIPDGQASPL